MDGLIPLIFKVLKKKKAMRYYRSLSSSSGTGTGDPAIAAGLARQLHHSGSPRALRWHGHGGEHGAAAPLGGATMTPRGEKLKGVGVAAMEAMPRETFSPRMRGGAGAPAIVGRRSYLGGGW